MRVSIYLKTEGYCVHEENKTVHVADDVKDLWINLEVNLINF